MTINISSDDAKLFEENGYTKEQVGSTIEHYRQQGLSDDEIQAKINTRISGFRGITANPENNNKHTYTPTVTQKKGDVLPSIQIDQGVGYTGEQDQPTDTPTFQTGITYNREKQHPIREGIRKAGRNVARFLLPKKAENWFLGSKEDEEFLKKYNDSNVKSFDQLNYEYKNGLISKDELIKQSQLRLKLDNLSADDNYRQTRNLNIGKGAIDIGTGFIPVGAGGKLVTKGTELLAPKLGTAIARGITQGTVGGGIAGGTHGVLTGAIDEDMNPITEGVIETGLGLGIGALTGGALSKGVQMYRANKLVNHKPLSEMSQEEIKNLRNQARGYYNDYIKGTSVFRDDLGKINFGNAGIDEQVSKGLHNVDVLPKLKKQIKSGRKQPNPRNDYTREDIKQFHIIENEINNKNMEYQIAEDINGNKYYFAKDITNNKGLSPTNRNQHPGSEINPNNIINDANTNFNPPENYFGAKIPESGKPTERLEQVYGQDRAKKSMGIEQNFNAEDAMYNINNPQKIRDTVRYEEAYDLLSRLTGKDKTWLKMYLSPNETPKNTRQTSFFGGLGKAKGKGTSKRQSAATKIIENLNGDEIEAMGLNNGDFPNYITQTAEDIYNNGIDQAAIIDRVMQDVGNDNFWKDPISRDALDVGLEQAEVKYKDLMNRIIKGDEKTINNATNELDNILKDIPEELHEDYVNRFLQDFDRAEQARQTEGLRAVGDIKKSQLAQNADLPPELRQAVNELPPEYQVLHNEDLMLQAQNMVDSNPNAVHSNLMKRAGEKTSNLSALDFENARQLVNKLYQEGRISEAQDIIDVVSKKASEAGQAVQALSLWSKTTPEGAVMQAQRIIEKYNETAKKKIPPLSEETAKEIIELAENIQSTELGTRENEIANGLLQKKFIDLTPQTTGNKLKSLRNISLLLNGKTFVRNLSGNTIFAGMENGITKPIAAGIDKIASLFNGKRSRVMPQYKDYGKGLIKGTKEGIEDVKLGIDTRTGIGGRFDMPQKRSFSDPVLGSLETALDYSLRVPDRAFYQATYNESLANQMRAAGVTEPTKEMLETAYKEAMESIYQNRSALGDTVLGGRKALNNLGIKDFGLGDALIPYAQTPANVAQQGINYSPLGFLKAGISAARGNQRQATLDAARAITGSGLMGLGYGGVKSGIINKGQDDYKVKLNYLADGSRPNTINLPNGAEMSYSQLQPLSAPIASGAALADVQNGDYMAALNSGIGTLADLSMVQGLTNFIGDYNDEGLGTAVMNTALNVPSQFVGSGLNQINAYVDPIQRETYSPNPLIKGINQARAKIPFVSKTMPKKYDLTGQEIEKYQGSGIAKMANVALNPVFINKPKNDPVIKEVTGLYEKTGEKSGLFDRPDKKIKLDNGETKVLNAKEYSEYSKRLGRITYELYRQEMNTNRYYNADNSTRLNLLNKAKLNAKAIVQEQLFNKQNKNSKNAQMQRKVENRLHKGRNRINRIMNAVDQRRLNSEIDNLDFDELYHN